QINSGVSLGAVSGTGTINNATLEATTNITSARNFALGSVNSTIIVDPGSIYTIGGVITDGTSVGTLNKKGTGTLVLTGSSTYSGGTLINSGTLQIGDGVAVGSGIANSNSVI